MSEDRQPARRGGAQIIPRPAAWELGEPAPWAGTPAPAAIDLDELAATIAARGPGRPMAVDFPAGRHSAVLIALFPGERGAEVVLTRRLPGPAQPSGRDQLPGRAARSRRDAGRGRPAGGPRGGGPRPVAGHGGRRARPDRHHGQSQPDRARSWATLTERPELRASAGEVDRILTAPLVDLLDAEVYREERWGRPPLDRAIHFFELEDETVWGATGRILVQLLSIATGVAQ